MRYTSGSTLKRKTAKGLCPVYSCRNKKGNKKTLCNKHHAHLYKEKHPIKYQFNVTRFHAKARGIEFTIPFTEYEQLVIESGYLDKKGHGKGALHIDRKDPRLGYISGNCVIIDALENVTKGANEDKKLKKENLPF